MTKEEKHYLNCDDANCEKAYCVDRRVSEKRILMLEAELEEMTGEDDYD